MKLIAKVVEMAFWGFLMVASAVIGIGSAALLSYILFYLLK